MLQLALLLWIPAMIILGVFAVPHSSAQSTNVQSTLSVNYIGSGPAHFLVNITATISSPSSFPGNSLGAQVASYVNGVVYSNQNCALNFGHDKTYSQCSLNAPFEGFGIYLFSATIRDNLGNVMSSNTYSLVLTPGGTFTSTSTSSSSTSTSTASLASSSSSSTLHPFHNTTLVTSQSASATPTFFSNSSSSSSFSINATHSDTSASLPSSSSSSNPSNLNGLDYAFASVIGLSVLVAGIVVSFIGMRLRKF